MGDLVYRPQHDSLQFTALPRSDRRLGLELIKRYGEASINQMKGQLDTPLDLCLCLSTSVSLSLSMCVCACAHLCVVTLQALSSREDSHKACNLSDN